MAEGVFRDLVKNDETYREKIGTIDSCGTGKLFYGRLSGYQDSDCLLGAYHVGDEPDDRTMSTLEDNGITDYTHAARKVNPPP